MLEKISNLYGIRHFLHWQPPGFKGVEVYYVIKYLYKALESPYFVLRAAAMAYNFFFSIFPTVMLIFMLLPYMPFHEIEAGIRTVLNSILPDQTEKLIENIVVSSMKKRHLGLISFSIVLILFTTTNGIDTMLKAFSRFEHEGYFKRNFFAQRLLALYILLVFILIVLVYIIALIFVSKGIHLFVNYNLLSDTWIHYLIKTLQFILNLSVLISIISFIYYISPSTTHRWKYFTPGSIIAGILLFFVSLAIQYFFTHLATFDKLYGSLAAIIMIMFWFYWISIVLLIGFELNVSIDKGYKKKALMKV